MILIQGMPIIPGFYESAAGFRYKMDNIDLQERTLRVNSTLFRFRDVQEWRLKWSEDQVDHAAEREARRAARRAAGIARQPVQSDQWGNLQATFTINWSRIDESTRNATDQLDAMQHAYAVAHNDRASLTNVVLS
jgi:hypothetical protein